MYAEYLYAVSCTPSRMMNWLPTGFRSFIHHYQLPVPQFLDLLNEGSTALSYGSWSSKWDKEHKEIVAPGMK